MSDDLHWELIALINSGTMPRTSTCRTISRAQRPCMTTRWYIHPPYSDVLIDTYSLGQIDTDYYLPVLLQQYFLKNPTGTSRRTEFFRYCASFVVDQES